MKLREGNVFSRICLSTGVRVPCDHYSGCIGSHSTGPSLCTGPHPWASLHRDLAPAPCWRYPVAKTGDLFKLVHLRTLLYCKPSPSLMLTSDGCLLKHYGSERAVYILLECLLVTKLFSIFPGCAGASHR